MNQIIIGDQARIETMNITQIIHQFQKEFDLDLLALDLEKLSNEMNQSARKKNEIKSAKAIENAKLAAKNKDLRKVVTFLKTGGQWALTMAEKIGLNIATQAIQKALMG